MRADIIIIIFNTNPLQAHANHGIESELKNIQNNAAAILKEVKCSGRISIIVVIAYFSKNDTTTLAASRKEKRWHTGYRHIMERKKLK